MVLGIMFILAGIMIAVYPQLLSLIVASILIFMGIFFILINRRLRGSPRKPDDSFFNFFLRH